MIGRNTYHSEAIKFCRNLKEVHIMKKFLKTIAKAYMAYLVINLIGAVITYIYGCHKFGRRMMNCSVRLALNTYKAWAKDKLMRLFFKPTKLDVSDMLTWDEI